MWQCISHQKRWSVTQMRSLWCVWWLGPSRWGNTPSPGRNWKANMSQSIRVLTSAARRLEQASWSQVSTRPPRKSGTATQCSGAPSSQVAPQLPRWCLEHRVNRVKTRLIISRLCVGLWCKRAVCFIQKAWTVQPVGVVLRLNVSLSQCLTPC